MKFDDIWPRKGPEVVNLRGIIPERLISAGLLYSLRACSWLRRCATVAQSFRHVVVVILGVNRTPPTVIWNDESTFTQILGILEAFLVVVLYCVFRSGVCGARRPSSTLLLSFNQPHQNSFENKQT